MKTNNLNKLAKRIHKLNHKWWVDLHTGKPLIRNRGEMLMLIITELAEAVEGIRKNLMDDHLPHRKMEEVEMADAVIRLADFAAGQGVTLRLLPRARRLVAGDGVVCGDNKADQILQICSTVCMARDHIAYEDELVLQAILQIECYCKSHGLKLWDAVNEKLVYNSKRKDHKVEHRLKANGKKW